MGERVFVVRDDAIKNAEMDLKPCKKRVYDLI